MRKIPIHLEEKCLLQAFLFQGGERNEFLLGSILLLTFPLVVAAAEIGGKPERVDVTVAYVSPSAALTPLFNASEAGLFPSSGLKAKVQIFGVAGGVERSSFRGKITLMSTDRLSALGWAVVPSEI